MEYIDDNIVRIADKDIRTYLGQCDKKFNKYPEIILSFGETFAEKGRTIASILGAIGIRIDKSNINSFSGNIRFLSREEAVINQKTGKRENKTFYQIVLKKVEDLDVEDLKEYDFVKLENSKILKEEIQCRNEIKIADNTLDFYLGQCNLDFQSHDQIMLSSTVEYIETVKYLMKVLNPLGIQIEDTNIDYKNKKIFFNALERERINPKTGRKERKVFYTIKLTKVPELFMYTDPRAAIEYPKEE